MTRVSTGEHQQRFQLADLFRDPTPDRVYVIAEVGSNHDGDLDRTLRLIEQCAKAGADAVKFQSWQTSCIQNRIVPDSGEPEPAFAILEKFELPVDWHPVLKRRCDELGVDFLSTPFDAQRARLLRELKVSAIKIASGDLTYTQLLNEVGSYGLPVLLSTGMASPDEIERALADLGEKGSARTVLLHCVGAYPPAFEDANVRALQTLAETFGLPVGISDHYPGHTTILAAIALGARVVEKHVTLSNADATPDSPFALEIQAFSDMVDEIRILERALGDGVKCCRPSEAGGLIGGRRALYWATDVDPGTQVSADHIAVLRPNRGDFQPADLDALVGRVLARPVASGQPVRRQDFDAG